MIEAAQARGHYVVECRDAAGKLRWSDAIENLVTTAGKNHALDTYLAGSAYTAAWHVGVISSAGYTTGPVDGDTAASHAGWAEFTGYSQGARPAAGWSAAAAGEKPLASPAVYTITGAGTVKGCFLVSDSTKGGAGGVLYSAGLFANGDKSVGSGDTLSVTYTAKL